VERSLKANGVSPYRSNSLVQVSDLHTTTMGLVSASISAADPLVKSTVSSSKHESISTGSGPSPLGINNEDKVNIDGNDLHLYEGVDHWHYLIQGEHATNRQVSSPRKAILHGKKHYHVSCKLYYYYF
jgi:hypothetical protein